MEVEVKTEEEEGKEEKVEEEGEEAGTVYSCTYMPVLFRVVDLRNFLCQ